jgi:hypothetical protein
MKRFQFNSIAKYCVAGVVLFATSSAFAIGPDYQYIPDQAPVGLAPSQGATNPTLNDVGILAGPGGTGTGTVIGWTTIDLSPDDSETLLSILTANHVATGASQVGFGVGYTPGAANPVTNNANGTFTPPPASPAYLLVAPLNTAYKTYTLPGAPINPKTGAPYTEDVSIMQAIVNNESLDAAEEAELDLVTANVPNLATSLNPTAVSDAGSDGVGITQVGYGFGGVWNNAAGTYTAYYQKNPSSVGYRRFQNNAVVSQTPVGQVGSYWEPLVTYNTLAANSATGAGTGFAGDSGSPEFTDEEGQGVTVTPNWGDTDPVVTPVDYTDDDSAVYVGVSSNQTETVDEDGDTVTRTKYTEADPENGITAPTDNNAVPLLDAAQSGLDEDEQGSYEWAEDYSNPLNVPEPGTLSLIALGGLAFLRRRVRR